VVPSGSRVTDRNREQGFIHLPWICLPTSKPHRDSYDNLLRIAVSYKRQAERCRQAKAYHAACILLASAVEALILAMFYCFNYQARKSTTYRYFKKARGKSILFWDMFHLIKLAKELGWIPGRISAGRSRYSPSDTIDQLRLIRNTIHPGNYLRTRHGNLLSAKDFRRTERMFQSCVEILEKELIG
jgi:hypothetical protein